MTAIFTNSGLTVTGSMFRWIYFSITLKGGRGLTLTISRLRCSSPFYSSGLFQALCSDLKLRFSFVEGAEGQPQTQYACTRDYKGLLCLLYAAHRESSACWILPGEDGHLLALHVSHQSIGESTQHLKFRKRRILQSRIPMDRNDEGPDRLIVEDPEDCRFTHTLILVVDICDAYANLCAELNRSREAVSIAQLQLDVCSGDCRSYMVLEEPAIDRLIQRKERQQQFQKAKLEECLKAQQLVTSRLQRNTAQRKKLFDALYEGAQRFVNRSFFGKVQFQGLEFSESFDKI